MIIPMLCVTIFVILVVWFLLPRVARLMIHTPTAISIFVCLSMVQLMAVFISMRCTLCGHFLQVALTKKTVTQFCRKLAAERPLKDIRDEYNYPKKKGIKDECSRLLEASTMKSRRGFAIQRLMNAMRQAHADGWFIVFDTL